MTLRRKLLLRGYDATEVDEAINKLKERDYLDDEAACRYQFETLYAEGKLSVRQIVLKLIQRGFDKDFIKELIPDDVDVHERIAAQHLLAKKFTTLDKQTFKAKAWQFLSSRGFGSEIISSAIEDFLQR